MKRLLSFLFLLMLAVAAPAASRGAWAMPCPASAPCDGFYVIGNQLVDPSGMPFRERGFNQSHYDSWGGASAAKAMGANTVRIALSFTKPEAANWAIVSPFVAAGIVPMIGNWTGTCKADPAVLSAIVDTWVAQAATWTKLNKTGLINIANEWGPSATTQQTTAPYALLPNYTWRDSYITGVQRMRAVGYTGTLVIDAGSCGQDAQDIVKYGQALLDADPLHNLQFDTHVYGGYHYPATASYMQDYSKAMAALKATGLSIVLGEFGPGRNIGPSPTMVTPATIIGDAEVNGFSWLAWASDDGNLPGCLSDDNWFALSKRCGSYTGLPAELTTFGGQVVPVLQAMARPAGI